MTPEPDDPRLTAFALGELTEPERSEVEARIAADPAAREEVQEMQRMAALLGTALARETHHVADPTVSEAVDRALAGTADPEVTETAIAVETPTAPESVVVTVPRWRFGLWPTLAALAAVLVVAVGLIFLNPGETHSRARLNFAKANSPVAPITPPPVVPAPTGTTIDREEVKAPEVKPSLRPEASSPTAPARPPVSAPVDTQASVVTAPASAGATASAATRSSQARRPEPTGAAGPPATGRDYAMQPELMKRYGLIPREAAPATVTPTAPGGPTRGLASDAGRVGRARVAAPGPVDSMGEVRMSMQPGPREAAAAGIPALAAGVREPGLASPLSTLAEAESKAAEPDLMRRYGLRPQPYPLPAPMPMPPPPPDRYWRPDDQPAVESRNPGYVDAGDNPFTSPLTQPLSTFSLDVDTGSYANVRRFLNAGMFPPRAAVRVEEMINYFPYRYAAPRGDDVFGVQTDVAACPWEPRHLLVRMALKARGIGGDRPAGNLVFLIDVSGSMQPGERLPLIKQGLRALVKRLSAVDRVAIVTYASSAGVRLESTSCEEKDRILEAIDSLEAGGSTNGEGGIRQAYDVARRHLIPGGVNRVLLCTDGDFNVGVSDQNELVRMISDQARSGVFLTTLGVGTDNFKDALMRRLADSGNGSYHYLDSFEEAQRVLQEQMDATFVTVARDAKAQVEFNPARVAAWRLIGYEKRLMAAPDFNDDTKDAGEIGAGQSVTVLYEIVPAGERVPGAVDPLKYQPQEPRPAPARGGAESRELLTLKLRYQRPEGSSSTLKEFAIQEPERGEVSGDFRFAAAVAAFGMALRDPGWDGGRGFDRALSLAQGSLGEDPGGWRAEFLTLVRKARGMPRR